MMKRWLRKLQRHWTRPRDEHKIIWEYRVVQMVSQTPSDPDDASRKLGGVLSADALRNQFPEHYSQGDGRAQIYNFLNDAGRDGWELIQIQQVADLPLMILKRPCRIPSEPSTAETEDQSTDQGEVACNNDST